MTVFVTVQATGEMTRLRRYVQKGPHRLRCTHCGLYDPETVTAPNVSSYLMTGPAQDQIGGARLLSIPAVLPA